jgi:hypothetical protein
MTEKGATAFEAYVEELKKYLNLWGVLAVGF